MLTKTKVDKKNMTSHLCDLITLMYLS